MSLGADLRTLRYLRIEQVIHRLWARARRPWFASALYDRLCLPAGDLPAPGRSPPSLTPGDADNGRRILSGRIRLLERERPLAVPVDWMAADETPLWRFTLHYFEWLADLAATGDMRWVDAARLLIADWIARHPRPNGGVAWHPYPLSLRLFAWLHHAPELLDGAPTAFRRAFVAALHRQAWHLSQCVEWDVGGNHAIKNLKALIAAGVCLPDHATVGKRALRDLQRAVARQVLPDGAHEERSPTYHLQVLVDLIDVADLLGDDSPAWLNEAIRRMGSALATLRLGDGGLALFNDGTVGEAALLAAVDARSGRLAAPADLPQAGYHRLAAGGTAVLFDAGPCCPDDLPAHAHADTLSFEMSTGPQRLIVNCGTFAYQNPAWRNRLRGTASHSTLTFAGEDSAEVHGVFRLGHRPREVGGRRVADSLTLEGWHDGYRQRGWRHRRRLTLDAAGSRLAGEDALEPFGDGMPGPAAIRFHLHPTVAAASDGPDGVRLTTPDETWRFIAEGPIAIEPSLYAPRFNIMEKTSQIVLHRNAGATGLRIAWRLERVGDGGTVAQL